MNAIRKPAKAIGIDTGGTFTDVIAVDSDGAALHLAKVASTNEDPGRAILGAIRDILPDWKIQPGDLGRLVHGTTVATNVVLEGKGARLGLLTTKGFSDHRHRPSKSSRPL